MNAVTASKLTLKVKRNIKDTAALNGNATVPWIGGIFAVDCRDPAGGFV